MRVNGTYPTHYRRIFIESWSDHDRTYLTINRDDGNGIDVLHQWNDEEVEDLATDGYWNPKKPSELVEYAVNMGLIEAEVLRYQQTGKG